MSQIFARSVPTLPNFALGRCLHACLAVCLTLCVGMLLFLASASVDPAHAQTEPASLADYAAALETAAAILQESSPTIAPPEQYQRARAALGSVERVSLPSGETVTLRPLLPPLPPEAVAPATLEIARARIHAVQAQLDAAAQDATADRLALLQEVWERPEFTAAETWWQRLRRWVSGWLERLLEPLGFGASLGRNWGFFGQLIVWTVVAVAATALVWLLSTWLRGLFGGLVREARVRRAHDDGGLPLTAQAAQQQAQRLAGAGNYRQAVRQLYLAALLTLEERGLLRHDRSLTNRELLQQLHNTATSGPNSDGASATLAPVEAHLQPVIDTFDAVWYGEREPDQQTFERYARELDALDEALVRAGYTKTGER